MVTASFEWNDETLVLQQPSLEYLSSLPPSFEWNQRGKKASTYTKVTERETEHRIRETLLEDLEKPGVDERLKEFQQKSVTCYRYLLRGDFEAVRNTFDNRGFYFIIGAPRTGGTYLLNEMVEMNGASLGSFNKKMIGDDMPDGRPLFNWRDSEGRNQLFFDLAQWLVWMLETLESFSFLPKKHFAFAQALPLIDRIFRDRATYVVTNRHPGEAAASYRVRLRTSGAGKVGLEGLRDVVLNSTNLSGDHWDQLDYNQKFLLYWASTYLSIQQADPRGTVVPLRFGSDHPDYVADLAQRRNVEHTPGAFTPSNRTRDEFWDTGEALEPMERVAGAWGEVFDFRP